MFFNGDIPFQQMRPPRKNPNNSKYYELLNIQKNASESEITKSYRKQALKYHPDREGGDEEKFKEINKAYEVLLDKEKREIYDKYGEEGLSENNTNSSNANDIFSSIFGGSTHPFGHNMGRPQQKQTTEDKEVHIEIDLKELYTGGVKIFKIKRQKVVNTGEKIEINSCKECGGKGVVIHIIRMGPMIQQSQQQCNVCNGSGQIIKGRKVVEELEQIEFKIERGMKEGDRRVYNGMSHETLYKKPGNLILIIKEIKHPNFERKDNHLFHKREILLCDALCGCEFILTHIDGTELLVKSNTLITNNTLHIIKNKGMPIKGNILNCGNLYIKFDIIFPDYNIINKENIKTILKSALPYNTNIINKDDKEYVELDNQTVNSIPKDIKEAYVDEDDNTREQHMNCHQQ